MQPSVTSCSCTGHVWTMVNRQLPIIRTRSYSILNEDDNISVDCIIRNKANYNTVCYNIHHLATDNMYSILTISYTSHQSPDARNTIKPIHASTPAKKISGKKEGNMSPLRILNLNYQPTKIRWLWKHSRYITKPDVVIATETWLDPQITNNQVFPSNYTVWWKDWENSQGGGVLIAVNNTYLSVDVAYTTNILLYNLDQSQQCQLQNIVLLFLLQPQDKRRKFNDSLNRAEHINDAKRQHTSSINNSNQYSLNAEI